MKLRRLEAAWLQLLLTEQGIGEPVAVVGLHFPDGERGCAEPMPQKLRRGVVAVFRADFPMAPAVILILERMLVSPLGIWLLDPTPQNSEKARLPMFSVIVAMLDG